MHAIRGAQISSEAPARRGPECPGGFDSTARLLEVSFAGIALAA
jgi:hypothetical protein